MIENITTCKHAIRDMFSDLPEQTKVLLGPSDYGGGKALDQAKFVLRILVGPLNEISEERVEELFHEVPRRIDNDPTLGDIVGDAKVTRCNGHQQFKLDQGEVKLGSEWSILVRD